MLVLCCLIALSMGCSRVDERERNTKKPNPTPDIGVEDVQDLQDTPALPDTDGPIDADCLSNADCSATRAVCDPLPSQCVVCLFDEHCGDQARCRNRVCEPVLECKNSLDCVALSSHPICDSVQKTCVACELGVDCIGNADCVDNQCQPWVACTNSLDCEADEVCDNARGRCVGCTNDFDCLDGASCVDNQCKTVLSCNSDRECTPHGLLCDRNVNQCTRCTTHNDCPALYHCSEGDCMLDVCAPGQTQCSGATGRLTCNAVGNDYGAFEGCPLDQICVQVGAAASCVDEQQPDPTCATHCTNSNTCFGATAYCFEGCCAECALTADCGTGFECLMGSCEALAGCPGNSRIVISDEAGIGFGLRPIGQKSSKTVTISNCSRATALRVSAIGLNNGTDQTFSIETASLPANFPAQPIDVQAGSSMDFILSYEPISEQLDTAELIIASDDSARAVVTVPVSGRGSDTDCPLAVGRGRVDNGTSFFAQDFTVRPLQTIELNGLQSSPTVVGYEWTILSRPPGSQAILSPSGAVVAPRLFLDLAGTYRIELIVYNADGVASCESSIVTIVAVPDEEIHIQLTWTAPAVPTPAQGRGTDLDLHYLHPLGRWNVGPYDVFWQNRRANWGSASEPSIASLDLDDLYGIGPENVNHSKPQNGMEYTVGVYYFHDNGFGPADAIVRVYVHGLLKLETPARRLTSTGFFWRAATIAWPAETVTAQTEVRFGFP